MNYRHSYHAGNFADAFKHIILIALVKSFLRKENPFCYLDTHAGIGHYDLASEIAKKTKEYETGIGKIFSQENQNDIIQTYLHCIKTLNPSGKLQMYPGSPYFVRQLLREHDRMVLCELQEDEYITLKSFFGRDKQTAIHRQDGYQALKAFLPPKERRGLVLIDPPYEKHDEFDHILSVLPQAIERWETGVFALWYPIKERRATDRFLEKLKNKILRPTLTIELSIHPENIPTHLNGSGMFIVNPPWQLDQQIQEFLPWLWKILSVDEKGQYRLNNPVAP